MSAVDLHPLCDLSRLIGVARDAGNDDAAMSATQ